MKGCTGDVAESEGLARHPEARRSASQVRPVEAALAKRSEVNRQAGQITICRPSHPSLSSATVVFSP